LGRERRGIVLAIGRLCRCPTAFGNLVPSGELRPVHLAQPALLLHVAQLRGVVDDDVGQLMLGSLLLQLGFEPVEDGGDLRLDAGLRGEGVG
jgi:hypothetical protein